jgi:hypothetical protein
MPPPGLISVIQGVAYLSPLPDSLILQNGLEDYLGVGHKQSWRLEQAPVVLPVYIHQWRFPSKTFDCDRRFLSIVWLKLTLSAYRYRPSVPASGFISSAMHNIIPERFLADRSPPLCGLQVAQSFEQLT